MYSKPWRYSIIDTITIRGKSGNYTQKHSVSVTNHKHTISTHSIKSIIQVSFYLRCPSLGYKIVFHTE